MRKSGVSRDEGSNFNGLGRSLTRGLVAWLSVALMAMGCLQTASAGVIGTRAALNADLREASIERVERLLAEDQVEAQLVALGVDPAWARSRVAGLTDAELALLEQEMEQLPAGGLLATIGVIFVVLLILEIVGVTDIFNKV